MDRQARAREETSWQDGGFRLVETRKTLTVCLAQTTIDPPNSTPLSAAQLSLDSCLPIVEAALKYVTKRYRLAAAEAEELRGQVHLLLVERNVLGAFRGRSSLRTYLTTIVH